MKDITGIMALWKSVENYSRMIKLSHSLFAMPFAGLALIQALNVHDSDTGTIVWKTFLIIVCMVAARSAGMGMNRYADRYIDSSNPRTAQRELPAGTISSSSVLFFIAISSLVFVGSAWLLNPLSFFLSFPALAVLFLYSFSKRFTWLCHYILGAGIGIAPLGAWVGMTGYLSIEPFFWFFGLLFQIAAFDVLYAMQDHDFDIKMKLHSIPSRFGRGGAYTFSIFSFVFATLFYIYAGLWFDFKIIYYLFILVSFIIMIYELDLARVHRGKIFPPLFYSLNTSISIFVFAGVIASEWSKIWN